MSDEERFQIIGKVVSEHEAAKKELALLQSKGKASGDTLRAVANALADKVDAWSIEGDRFLTRSGHETTQGPLPLSWDDIVRLLSAIRETKTRIAELDAERKRLGV